MAFQLTPLAAELVHRLEKNNFQGRSVRLLGLTVANPIEPLDPQIPRQLTLDW